MWTVYVLQSLRSGKYYVGMTTNLDQRLREHNAGRSKFTSGHIPWIVIYTEQVDNSALARKREKYLKSAAGKKFIAKQLGSAGSLPA